MLARLQKFVSISLLFAAVIWAVGFAAVGRPIWAATGALTILLGYVLFLAAEFAALYFVQRADVAPRPSVRQLIAAWWNEALTAPRVFLWRQPFRATAESDHVPPDAGATSPGVVLVHGFVCNRGLWNPWMRELRARGVPFVALNLEPVFGSIDHYPQIIEDAVARVERATGMPVVLVGHSMGGVAIRAWLARFDADARVRRVLTIGSPHHGTWLARFGHTINGRQMRLNGPWLAELVLREPPERYAKFTCYFGHCDNIVFPAASGTLPRAENVHVPGTAHVHMAFSPVVFEGLLRWLR
jgi:triacylglycerol lipase